jgi:hypothetical protein
LADARDDIMSVGSTEATGRDTTNAAKTDHGDGETRLGGGFAAWLVWYWIGRGFARPK